MLVPHLIFSSNRIIYDKIDEDKSGSVTEDELTDWIKFTQERYVKENTKSEFEDRDTDKDNKVQWDEYFQRSYGFLAGLIMKYFLLFF